MANLLEDIALKILNSKATTRFVETMTSVQEAVSEKIDEYLPSSGRIEGCSPKSKNPRCRYSIDQCKCSEWGYKCDMLVGRKPPCQKCCPNDAIIWTGDYMELISENVPIAGSAITRAFIMQSKEMVSL